MTSAAEVAPRRSSEPGSDRDAASFRDRDGYVFARDGRIFRALSATGAEDWRSLRNSEAWRSLTSDGLLVQTSEAGSGELFRLSPDWPLVLEHAAIPAITYPYEWSFGMLKDAALAQLETLQRLLADRLILKDGTPYNVQWRGARPTFIDIGSGTTTSRTRLWEGYRQFCRLQLYPLLLQALLGVDFRPFLRGRADGPTAAEASALLGWRNVGHRGVLTHVHLHAKVESGSHRAPARMAADPELSTALVARNVAGLRRAIERLEWSPRRSTWSEYGDRTHYAPTALTGKERFVAECLASRRWRLVWDIGCNDGRFSRLAADKAAAVLAMDSDLLTVDRLYAQLKSEGNAKILPLCVDLADASPGQGWRGRERPRLEDRARPDLVLGLAVIHHLVIGANLPLEDVVDWFRSLGASLIIEWVDRSDPMVKQMLTDRRDVFNDYTRERFEAAMSRNFRTERRLSLDGGTRELLFSTPLDLPR